MTITHDNSTDGQGSGVTLTFSKTNTGTTSTGILWVGVTVSSFSSTIAGFTCTVTYNSVSMTEVRSGTTTGVPLVSSGSNSSGLYLFYLLNPATGANNVVVTTNSDGPTISSVVAGASSYTGVLGVNNATSTSSPSANSPTLVISSRAVDQAFTTANHGDTISGSGTGTNERFRRNNSSSSGGDNIVGGDEAGALTVSMDFTSAVNDQWALIGANMLGAAADAAPTLNSPIRSALRLR